MFSGALEGDGGARLDWCTTVIGGGTPNIQKNIISERILRLPHD